MSSSDHDIIVISSETAEKSGNESDQEEKDPQPITKSVKKKFTRTRNKQKQDGNTFILTSDYETALREAPKHFLRTTSAAFKYTFCDK